MGIVQKNPNSKQFGSIAEERKVNMLVCKLVEMGAKDLSLEEVTRCFRGTISPIMNVDYVMNTLVKNDIIIYMSGIACIDSRYVIAEHCRVTNGKMRANTAIAVLDSMDEKNATFTIIGGYHKIIFDGDTVEYPQFYPKRRYGSSAMSDDEFKVFIKDNLKDVRTHVFELLSNGDKNKLEEGVQ